MCIHNEITSGSIRNIYVLGKFIELKIPHSLVRIRVFDIFCVRNEVRLGLSKECSKDEKGVERMRAVYKYNMYYLVAHVHILHSYVHIYMCTVMNKQLFSELLLVV